MSLTSKFLKGDYYLLFALVIYSIYIYLSRNYLQTIYYDIISNSNIPSFQYTFFIIMPLIFLSFIFYSFNNMKDVKISKQGFRLGRAAWISLGVIIVGTILSVTVNEQIITIKHSLNLFVFILNVLISELVYRVILLYLAIKIMENSKIGFYFAIILSGLFFAFSQIPLSEISVWFLFSVMVTGLLYYQTDCLLFILFWDIFMLLDKSELKDELMIGIISILLYFALAVPAHFIQKRKLKENILTSQT